MYPLYYIYIYYTIPPYMNDQKVITGMNISKFKTSPSPKLFQNFFKCYVESTKTDLCTFLR